MKLRFPQFRRLPPATIHDGLAEDGPLRPVGAGDTVPVLVQDDRATVRLSGERVIICQPGAADRGIRLDQISQVALLGNVTITTPCIHALLARGIPIAWHAASGWLHGAALGAHGRVALRKAQYSFAEQPKQALGLASSLIAAKITNARTLLRRRVSGVADNAATLDRLAHCAQSAGAAQSFETLLGIEGTAARLYFAALPQMLQKQGAGFRFEGRSRQPPADPVNAMLSFSYAMLLRHWVSALTATGFDPYLGFYHRPLSGRMGLALDLMEPFRPLVADSAVIGAVNNGEIGLGDFQQDGSAILLNAQGRKAMIAAFERRMDILLTDPVDAREKSYRALFTDQSMRLAQFLLGERKDFPHHTPR